MSSLDILQIIKNGTLYVSETYEQNLQTFSSAVQYLHNLQPKLGILQTFIKLKNCNCVLRECQCAVSNYAIAQEITSQSFFNVRGDYNVANDSPAFLHKCNLINNIIAISVEALTAVCIYININEQIYIALPINQKERE